MGSGGVPSGGVSIVHASRHISLPKTGKPNSKTILYVNGSKIQSRWYDSQGRAIRNRDYSHGNGNGSHTFPHDHEWGWNDGIGIRNSDWELPNVIAFPEETNE